MGGEEAAENLSWTFQQRLEVLWEMERSGASIEMTASRHRIEIDLLRRWKRLYEEVSDLNPGMAALLGVRAQLEEQVALLENAARELSKLKSMEK